MTPLSFEWRWDAPHFIFMGLLYLVLAVIGSGFTYAFIKTWLKLHDEGKKGSTETPHTDC
jgi:hypothetical protein